MKKIILILILAVSAAMAAPSLVPLPLELKETGQTFALQTDASILYSGSDAKPVAELLAKQLRSSTGFELLVLPEQPLHSTDGNIVLRDVEDESLGREGYVLEITSYVSIQAKEPAGLFYGRQTLRQLFPADIFSQQVVHRSWKTQTVEIRDVPRFVWRDMHLNALILHKNLNT